MSQAEAVTNTRDETYNLVSVLYHALQGIEAYAKYRKDAEAAGETELAEFFGEVINRNRDIAERAKSLMAAKMLTAQQRGVERGEVREPAPH